MTLIEVQIKLRSKRSAIEVDANGVWRAYITSPPIAGQVNQELLGLVARHFGVPRSRVRMKRGGKPRLKLVEISD
ncbi:MAG: DUF167 domain-containing protein [Pseudomonadota bacterium]